jgi:tetratricopeptide (TPR) repeat protein
MKNRVKTHLIQARRFSARGNRAQALESIKKALTIDPGEIVITEVLISMERADDPETHQNAHALGGNTVQQSTSERNKTADMDPKLEKINRLSDEALASGNKSKALAYLKKAVELFPNEEEAEQKLQQLKNRIRAGNLVKIGIKKLSEGDTKKAITASRRAFNLQPDAEGLQELLDLIEQADGNTPEVTKQPAPETVRTEIKPATPRGEALLWADRIRTAVQDDQFEEAGKMVAEAIRRYPEDTLLDSFYTKLKRLGFVKAK